MAYLLTRCSLRLGPNLGVLSGADKNYYLRLTAEKMRALLVFTDKYLRLYGCSGTHFKAVVNRANPITEI